MYNNTRMSFKKKIISMNILSVVLLCITILLVVYYQTKKAIDRDINNQLNSNINLGYSLLESKYPGEWKVDDNKLFKGEKCLNDDTEFVDEFKKATNSLATIFLKDTRVSTNILVDGKRATGTKASDEVISKVLITGEEYIGDTNILGTAYTVKYIPIKNNKGDNIGMMFSGVEKSAINSQMRNLMYIIVFLTVVIMFIVIIVCILFANSINKNIKVILHSLKLISSGDLTVDCKVNSKDEINEIAENLNITVKNIKNLLYDIKYRSESLQHNSETLSATSGEMSSSSESVSDAIHDVAAGNSSQSEELSNITNITVQFSKELESIIQAIKYIDENSRGINSLASNNNDNMEDLIGSIRKISTSFNDFTSKMEGLTEKISHINRITTIINNISDQTNLLALNAAIEAAKAGEYGKGFSVVAEEVRKLADESKNSSKEIISLITSIANETSNLILTFKVISDELNNQINNTNSTINSFRKITEAVDEIIPQINLVNSSTTSINCEKNLILKKVEEVSSTAEEVSASSEEIAASSQEMNLLSQEVALTAERLSRMTMEMMIEVNKFKVQPT